MVSEARVSEIFVYDTISKATGKHVYEMISEARELSVYDMVS